MATSDKHYSHQHKGMRAKADYIPVNEPEEKDFCSDQSADEEDAKDTVNVCDVSIISGEISNFEAERGIDYDVVDELVRDINELRNGLVVLLLLFFAVACFIALDDHYSYKKIVNDDGNGQIVLVAEDIGRPPHPHMGHKLQLNASAFTVNDYECLQLDTGNWPSERVHCELQKSEGNDTAQFDFVVEHFDDENCQVPNAKIPVVRHTASGCYFFERYNHSYNDQCHNNRTLTVSAFYGSGCLIPMSVTAVNILPEE